MIVPELSKHKGRAAAGIGILARRLGDDWDSTGSYVHFHMVGEKLVVTMVESTTSGSL
jgi:hypothetical protein